MYTFQPLVDTDWNSHVGFYMVCMMAIAIMAIIIYAWKDDELSGISVVVWAAFFAVIVGIGHWVSYQPERVYANTQVTGEFVGFNPEVLTEKSGKNSYRVDRKMWVTYRVGDALVVLEARPATSYPKNVILYKN